jgi:hypothetical protein
MKNKCKTVLPSKKALKIIINETCAKCQKNHHDNPNELCGVRLCPLYPVQFNRPAARELVDLLREVDDLTEDEGVVEEYILDMEERLTKRFIK